MSNADTFSAFIKNIFPRPKVIIYYDRLSLVAKKEEESEN